jgi:hypothetical protein
VDVTDCTVDVTAPAVDVTDCTVEVTVCVADPTVCETELTGAETLPEPGSGDFTVPADSSEVAVPAASTPPTWGSEETEPAPGSPDALTSTGPAETRRPGPDAPGESVPRAAPLPPELLPPVVAATNAAAFERCQASDGPDAPPEPGTR